MRKAFLSVAVLAATFIAGCGTLRTGEKFPTSLYDRLGGAPAIRAVVDDFVPRAASDPKVNFMRKGIPGAEWQATDANVAHLKQQLVDFITMATGGPNNYKGRDMRSAHVNMKITIAEFDAIADDFQATLDHLKVPAKEQGEVMVIVGTTRKDIVTAGM